MSFTNNKLNINESTDQTESVGEFLGNLDLGRTTTGTDDEKKGLEEKVSSNENLDQDSQWEVTRVSAHKIKGTTIRWRVHFRGGTSEWVSDSDCNCEALIQEYLSTTGTNIRTIYVICRVSSKKQAGPTHVSLKDQKVMIEKAAGSLKPDGHFNRIKTYHITSSAYKGVPKVLQDIGEVSRKGDMVMVYRVDRLSRNIVKYLSVLEEMHEKGVYIYAVEDQLWYHHRKLDFLQLVLDANKESALISRRVKRSVAYRRNRGDYVGGVPYGWKLERDIDGIVKKVQNAEEQKVIKIIRKGGRFCYAKTADKLNERGLRKRGKVWTSAMVKYVIKQIYSRW